MTVPLHARHGSGSSKGSKSRSSDLVLAALLTAIVALMIVPLPLFILDSLLALNMTLGIVLILMAIYVSSPLQFSVFPSVLLISTLFRLALSVATTRLILLNGDAGKIIETFGELVAGGNIVVGMVMFLIITVVQFLVIAKGAERVAEVGARFTLDAMPGKQMSIDSDLRSGLIDQMEAKRKRDEVELESQLHGSMDGAMKFVKGDAIAGIIIILVNLIGGLTIGVSQLDMSAADAMTRYSTLTIGDGMVAQIPALFSAMSAGLIVTRVTPKDTGDNLGLAMHKQLTAIPRVLIVAGVISCLFGAVPGFPTVTFFALGLTLCVTGVLLIPTLKRRVEKAAEPTFGAILNSKRDEQSRSVQAEDTNTIEHSKPLVLELPAVLAQAGYDESIRDALVAEVDRYQQFIGMKLPTLSLQWNKVVSDSWTLYAFEVPIASAEISTENPIEKLTTAINSALVAHGHLYVGLQEVSEMMATTSAVYPDSVTEVKRLVPMQNLATIFRNLVQENISLRNMRTILEALVNAADRDKDVNNLTEVVRISLTREISHRYAPDGTLTAIAFTPKLEEYLNKALRVRPGTQQLALDPMVAEKIRLDVLREVEAHKPAVILVSTPIRRACHDALGESLQSVPILAYAELMPNLTLNVVERIDFEQAPTVRSVAS